MQHVDIVGPLVADGVVLQVYPVQALRNESDTALSYSTTLHITIHYYTIRCSTICFSKLMILPPAVHQEYRASQSQDLNPYTSVSENRGPSYSTLNSRTLIIRTPQLFGNAQNSPKLNPPRTLMEPLMVPFKEPS